MKPLNRPMFRRGGKVSSRNNGIVSGFENGGSVRQNFQNAGFVDAINEYLPEPERQRGLSTADYLRIASAGAEIMGAQPTGRSGFVGALQAASPALAGLGQDLATSMGEREQNYQDQLNKRNQILASAAGEEYMADKQITAEKEAQERTFEFEEKQADKLAKAQLLENQKARESAEYIARYQTDNQMFEFREKTKDFNEAYTTKSVAQEKLKLAENGTIQLNPDEIKKLNDDIKKADSLMQRLQAGSPEADTLEAALDNLLTPDAVDSIRGDVASRLEKEINAGTLEEFSDEYFKKQGQYLEENLFIYFNSAKNAVKTMEPSNFASGGRVGLQNGGDPMMEQMPGPGAAQTTNMEQQEQPTLLTFAELRKRLPQEVTDKVITLLVQSEEALLDFTRIQVPEDINKFNQKYGTDLTLPTQVA
tara:strand:- start:4292 stop:5554 length:1263 start_codon:yes stop_codon:yes gene_type:complete